MTVADVCAALDRWAPPAYAYDWDRIGLATGQPSDKVATVLCALTVTTAAYKAAVKANADMIVAHHPLIWEPLSTLRTDRAEARLCVDLVKQGIACYSAHTNLDVTPGGVNDILADRLGLVRRSPLFPAGQAKLVKLVTFAPESHLARIRDAVSEAGAGVIGEYTHCSFSSPGTGTFKPSEATNPFSGRKHVLNEEPELKFETLVAAHRLPDVLNALFAAHPYDEPAYDVVTLENRDRDVGLGLRGELETPVKLGEFARHVREKLDLSFVKLIGKDGKRVRTVAVLGGSGGGSAGNVPDDVDVYVTGDVKFHDALAADERGLAVVDAGHHGTEKWIVPALAAYLKKTLDGVAVKSYMEPETFRVVSA